jgi:DNA polymerase-3 subunit epsilon
MNFVAIDFETANAQRSSPCAVGLCVVDRGHISENYAKLIRPPDLCFHKRNIAIHGIHPKDVENEPEFPAIWENLKPFIENRTLVAHSAKFDISVLKGTLSRYDLQLPTFRYLCTAALSRKVWPAIGSYTLKSVACKLGIQFDHHDARADAYACAEIVVRACAEMQCKSLDELTRRMGIEFGDPSDMHSCDNGSQVRRSWQSQKSAAEIIPSTTDFDPAHPLYSRVVVFTGPLISMTRSEAMQIVADAGGQPADSVTRKTDLLVVGGRYFDVFSHQTGKLKKATELARKGNAIDIIGEDDFLKLLAE